MIENNYKIKYNYNSIIKLKIFANLEISDLQFYDEMKSLIKDIVGHSDLLCQSRYNFTANILFAVTDRF